MDVWKCEKIKTLDTLMIMGKFIWFGANRQKLIESFTHISHANNQWMQNMTHGLSHTFKFSWHWHTSDYSLNYSDLLVAKWYKGSAGNLSV